MGLPQSSHLKIGSKEHELGTNIISSSSANTDTFHITSITSGETVDSLNKNTDEGSCINPTLDFVQCEDMPKHNESFKTSSSFQSGQNTNTVSKVYQTIETSESVLRRRRDT